MQKHPELGHDILDRVEGMQDIMGGDELSSRALGRQRLSARAQGRGDSAGRARDRPSPTPTMPWCSTRPYRKGLPPTDRLRRNRQAPRHAVRSRRSMRSSRRSRTKRWAKAPAGLHWRTAIEPVKDRLKIGVRSPECVVLKSSFWVQSALRSPHFGLRTSVSALRSPHFGLRTSVFVLRSDGQTIESISSYIRLGVHLIN